MAELPKDETLFERRRTMKKVKMVSNWRILMVLITVALMTSAIAQAKSLKIWPEQLILPDPSTGYYQTIFEVRNATFYAILSLPSGTTITKITYYHSSNSGATSLVIVRRQKMGGYPENIAQGQSTDSTANTIPVDVVLTGDPVIRSGYRYFVEVSSNDVSTSVSGVKIDYK